MPYTLSIGNSLTRHNFLYKSLTRGLIVFPDLFNSASSGAEDRNDLWTNKVWEGFNGVSFAPSQFGENSTLLDGTSPNEYLEYQVPLGTISLQDKTTTWVIWAYPFDEGVNQALFQIENALALRIIDDVTGYDMRVSVKRKNGNWLDRTWNNDYGYGSWRGHLVEYNDVTRDLRIKTLNSGAEITWQLPNNIGFQPPQSIWLGRDKDYSSRINVEMFAGWARALTQDEEDFLADAKQWSDIMSYYSG